MSGCSLDEKIWNARINTPIADANPPSCSLRCLTTPCEETAHPCPVGVVIDHLLGAGRVRRMGGDLVLDTRPAGSHSEKEEIVRLEGKYFYRLQGKAMGFSRQAQIRRSIRNDVRSDRAVISSKILWQWFGFGPGPPLLAEKQVYVLFNPLILSFRRVIATHGCATRPTLWNPSLVSPTIRECRGEPRQAGVGHRWARSSDFEGGCLALLRCSGQSRWSASYDNYSVQLMSTYGPYRY